MCLLFLVLLLNPWRPALQTGTASAPRSVHVCEQSPLRVCVRADFYAFGVGVYVLWAAVSLLRTAAILSRRSLLALMRPLALAVAIGIKMAVVLTLWVRRARTPAGG